MKHKSEKVRQADPAKNAARKAAAAQVGRNDAGIVVYSSILEVICSASIWSRNLL